MFSRTASKCEKIIKIYLFFLYYPWQVNNEGLNYAVGVTAIVRGVAPL